MTEFFLQATIKKQFKLIYLFFLQSVKCQTPLTPTFLLVKYFDLY